MLYILIAEITRTYFHLQIFFYRVKKHYKASEAIQDSNTSKNQANVLDPNKQGGQK